MRESKTARIAEIERRVSCRREAVSRIKEQIKEKEKELEELEDLLDADLEEMRELKAGVK